MSNVCSLSSQVTGRYLVDVDIISSCTPGSVTVSVHCSTDVPDLHDDFIVKEISREAYFHEDSYVMDMQEAKHGAWEMDTFGMPYGEWEESN